jgi:hypothetical protein
MHVDPDQRLTAQQALATPWVATGGLGRSDDLGGEARRRPFLNASPPPPSRRWEKALGKGVGKRVCAETGRRWLCAGAVVAGLSHWLSCKAVKKAVIGVIAGILQRAPGQELDTIRAAFREQDRDGSGTLSISEFRYGIDGGGWRPPAPPALL